MENCQRAVDAGVALLMNRHQMTSADVIHVALDSLLKEDSPIHANVARVSHIVRIENQGAPRRAAEFVEKIAGLGLHSSVMTPQAVSLNFWQQKDVDIWLAVVGVLSAALTVFCVVATALCKCLFGARGAKKTKTKTKAD